MIDPNNPPVLRFQGPVSGSVTSSLDSVVMFVRGGTPSILRVKLADLDGNGRSLYSTLRQQSLDMNYSLLLSSGWFYVCITDPSMEAPNLCLQVKTCVVGESTTTLWKPRIIDVAGVTNGGKPPSHTAVFNLIARQLEEHLSLTGRQVWMNPEWITKTEASAIVSPAGGNPVSRIANLANTGKLATWDNPSAKSRQGRSMVYRPQVTALLEKLMSAQSKAASRKKTP